MPDIKPTRKIKGAKQSAPPRLKTYRMPEALIARIESAATATGLKPADIVRLSIDQGVDMLLGRLTKTTEGDA